MSEAQLPQTHENPLMKKIKMPGKKFRLPSRGVFYKDGELDDTVHNGEVEIFSMSAVDEINLRTPDLLFSGEAIERVFTRCIPQIKKPLELMSKDVDFLLGALRVVSYGGTFEYEHRCPKCQEEQDSVNEQKLKEFETEVREKAEVQNIAFESAWANKEVQTKVKQITSKKVPTQKFNIDVNGMIVNKTVELTEDSIERYTHTLSNDQVIKYQPMRLNAAVYIYQLDNMSTETDQREPEFIEEYLAFLITCCVYSVDGHTDRGDIAEWAKSLPVKLKNEINDHLENMDYWGTDFDEKIKCRVCGHETSGSAVSNPISFFT